MKSRKYILIVLAFLTSLLCTVGASLWVVLTDKIVKPDEFKQIAPTCTDPTINPIFYGEQAELTHSPQEGDTVGTWSISDTTTFTASSTTTTSDTAGNKIVQTTAKATLTFTPSNIKYSPVTKEFTVPMYAVASYGSTYYTRLDDALATTTSGTVYALPFGHEIETGRAINAKTIHGDITIDETLCLPYSGTTYKNREGTNGAFADTAESTYLKNLITIEKNATITNKGTIIIGGILGTTKESGNQGHTSGNYAQINMGENSHIANSGTIECYGFIKDNNDSSIDNTGTIKAPFVVYDYLGPSHTVGAYKADNGKIAPFNIFDMPNIYSKITTYSTSTINAFIDLYTQHDTLGSQHNLDEIIMFASSNSVMDLHSGASVVMDYRTTASPTQTIGLTDLHFSGGANSGAFSVRVTFKLGSLTVVDEQIKMDTVLFPISLKFNITFDDGTYNISNQYKLMPGSKITITESAIAEVSNNVILYTGDFQYHYPKSQSDALLQVDGTLNLTAGSFGGYITPGKNSTLTINEDVGLSIESREGSGLFTYNGGLSFSFSTTFTKNSASPTKSLILPLYNGSSSTIKSAYTGTTYTELNNAWCPESISITYNSKQGSTIANTSGHKVYSSGYTIPESINENENTVPTRDNYIFLGWYLDPDCTQAAVGSTIWDYTTLYAGWEQAADKILVSFQLIGSNTEDIDAMNNEAFKTQEMSDTVTKATQPNIDSLYQFNLAYPRYIVGYYSDPSGTTTFDFTQTITQSTTIYVKWADKHTLTITLKTGANGSGSIGAGTGATPTATITTNNTDTSISSGTTYYLANGQKYTITATDAATISGVTVGSEQTATKNITGTITGTKGSDGWDPCIIEGTLITLADGTQKAVEDLQVGDMLLVFNHYTGKYDAKPLVINAHAEEVARLHNVLNIRFSNGTIWRIAGTHGIYDCTLNKYVMISYENIDEYVGHQFYYTDGEAGSKVTLTNYFVTEDFVKIYSPATLDFANYFANGLLNAPPLPDTYTAGQMNYFDFDENMTYDEEKMQADIERYGLYTYEDFKDYIPEEVFNALPFKYFKISVGKGIMTWEEIMSVIDMLWG